MSKLTVIDHHHDEEGGVYRLTVGYPIERSVPVLDQGKPVYGPDVPLTDEDGEPVLSGGEPIVSRGAPLTETVTEYVPTEDFVFAADDDRWADKAPAAIAQEQRRLIKEALDEREREAAANQPGPTAELPGVGTPL